MVVLLWKNSSSLLFRLSGGTYERTEGTDQLQPRMKLEWFGQTANLILNQKGVMLFAPCEKARRILTAERFSLLSLLIPSPNNTSLSLKSPSLMSLICLCYCRYNMF